MHKNNLLQEAERYFQAGDLEMAEQICKGILDNHQDDVDALHMLGIIYYEVGNYDVSLKFLNNTLRLSPENADVYYDIGNVYFAEDHFDTAIYYYKEALRLNPQHLNAYNNLGNIFHEKEQNDDAESYYRKALEIAPHVAYINNNLGLVLQDKGQLDDAITYYQKAILLNPKYTDAYYNLGNIFFVKDKLGEAILYYQRAVDLDPEFAEAHGSLGIALKDHGLLEKALDSLNRALTLGLETPEVHLNIGYIYDFQGRKDEAIAAFDKALMMNPNFFKARYARCMSQLSVIYMKQSDIDSVRKKYHDELFKIRETLSLETEVDKQNAADAVGSLQPFLLAYQGFNDRELQQFYGEMICNIMASRYPKYSKLLQMPPSSASEKIRIGIVSSFFYGHSNWKIPIKGWVKNLNKERFELYGYHTGEYKDQETNDARNCFNHFYEDIASLENLCQTIYQANLHVLIYPEIGMDPITVKLASLRLAPVQCTSWGHPDTSGLPTIDYFLSSDLMEPSNADHHYTERLVRLPNLSIFYTPLDVIPYETSRVKLGLRPHSRLYLCCQSLSKYLPQYDEIYPRIAQQIKDCQFIFISSHLSNQVTEIFRLRLEKVFRMYRLSADDYVVFLPRLNNEQYYAVNRLSDIYLDSIGWSGCNSTFEAIACNLPIVTYPGELMRGRHSSAILTMIGLKETIAANLDEYILLAVRLGKDSEWRQYVSNKISNSKHLAYHDRTCITALEDFFKKVVTEDRISKT